MKQPNLPFYVIKPADKVALDQLSREYRKSLRRKSARAKTPKSILGDSDSEREKASNFNSEGRYPEEPQSGYIDYTKIFKELD